MTARHCGLLRLTRGYHVLPGVGNCGNRALFGQRAAEIRVNKCMCVTFLHSEHCVFIALFDKMVQVCVCAGQSVFICLCGQYGKVFLQQHLSGRESNFTQPLLIPLLSFICPHTHTHSHLSFPFHVLLFTPLAFSSYFTSCYIYMKHILQNNYELFQNNGVRSICDPISVCRNHKVNQFDSL